MDNQKIINRLSLLEASASVILEEAAKLRKEFQQEQPSAEDEQFEIKKAKVLAKYRKNLQKSA